MDTVDQIGDLLAASGLSGDDLARQWGVSPSTVSRYLNRKRGIPDEFASWAINYLREKCLENASRSMTAAMKVAA